VQLICSSAPPTFRCTNASFNPQRMGYLVLAGFNR
jgi:hypothetical protein